MGMDPGGTVRRVAASVPLFLALWAYGCASGSQADIATLASNSDQVIWEAGQKAVEKKQWSVARQYFKRIVDGFPQSQFGPAARLALADSHFGEGGTANQILAISEYRDFVTLYPSHPKSDYAQFRIGEAYFAQKNSPDRDQTSTYHALAEYEHLLEAYPSSSFVEEARGRISTCRQILGRSEFLAGYFYQRTRHAYRSAISRYEGILNDYPDYDYVDEVLFRLAQCLIFTARGSEALPHLSKLIEVYPTSEWADEAKKLMAQLSLAPPPAAPSTPPPAAPTAAGPPPGPGTSEPPPPPAPPEAPPQAPPSPTP
jgi:outer membrane protein assembly factor BamD